MIFNSFSYAVFLPIVFMIYWILPPKHRVVLLLLVSYYFYMCWNPKYAILIGFTTLVSYACGILLERTSQKWARQSIMMAVVLACLGVLFIFKYYNFTVNTISRFFL